MYDSTARSRARIFARILAGIALCLAAANPALAQLTSSGLIARYSLDGNLDDSTANAYDGTATGGPRYGTGLFGESLTFDGVDDALRFGRIPNTAFAGDFTVSWYMKAQSLDQWSLLSKRDACAIGNYFDAEGSRIGTNQIAFSLVRSGIGGEATARKTYFAGGWLHVALVRRGTQAQVYVDGEPGTAVALPTLDFSRIIAQLGFSTSPCIGTGGVRAFQGSLDEVRVYNRALAEREIDELASIPKVTPSPASVSPGARLSYLATELDIGTRYSLRLFDGATNPVLDSFDAAAVSQSRKVTMPNAVVGRWPLRLQVVSPRGLPTTHASTTLTVTQGLAIAVRTTTPQAGKSLVVDVSRLAPGRLQLRYAGRIVSGPVDVDAATTVKTLKFVAPADIPSSLPASVELRAELLAGRTVGRMATLSVPVAAPFTGPFALPTGVTTSVASASSRTPVNVRGRLQLADGATSLNTQVTAYWVGDDGAITPLPTHSLSLASDGTFDLATRPSGINTMTAVVAAGPGFIRLVAQRAGANGRPDWQVSEGPRFTSQIDVDAQTDITFVVRRAGSDDPISNALIVFDAGAPIQEFDLPPAPPSGGESGYELSGDAFFGNARVNDLATLAGTGPEDAGNQGGDFIPATLPEPPCGPDLFRRYTDFGGRASINLLGSAAARGKGQQQAIDYPTFRTQRFRATNCSGGSCVSTDSVPLKFRASIYTAHRGAGVIDDGREVPLVFEFEFDRATREFTITNKRTGEVTTQTNSVNLTVTRPVLTSNSGYVYIQTPFVYAVAPTLGAVTRETGGDFGARKVEFSGWINFGSPTFEPLAPEYSFVNAAPQFNLSFFHSPDAGGVLTGAKLYLDPLTGPEFLYGDFARSNVTPSCTLQDDGTFNGNHLWEVRLQGEDWRDPTRMGALLSTRASSPSISGRIEYRDSLGAIGNYPVVFKWKAPPSEVLELADVPNPEPVSVSDIRVGVVQFLGQKGLGSDDRERQFPAQVGGNTLSGPRTKRNESSANQLVNITSDGDEDVSGARIVNGNVGKQYNEGPRSRTSTVSVGGAITEFGPREYKTLLDEEILLMQVTWGIPGLAGVDAYAAMRILAEYWFGGRAGLDDDGDPFLETLTEAAFSIGLVIGIDIDVLFGLLFDAGVNITGGIGSRMQTSYVSDRADEIKTGNCLNIFIILGVYFDPCPICPTPAFTEDYPVMDEGSTCPLALGDAAKGSSMEFLQPKGLSIVEQRSLRRHAAIRFDEQGNGGIMALDDNRNVTFTSLADGDDAPPVVMSTARGQRQPSIAYYAPNRAISVWVESALNESELRALDTSGYGSSGFPVAVRNQRLAWSRYNGSSWSPKELLTLPGTGEGFPVLEACKDGKPGCPAGGSVFLAFQRNINANFAAPRNRIHHASWTPSGSWTAITATPAGPDATQDITPSVVFVDGRPLLLWVRILSGNQLTLQRRLMWQFVGLGGVNGEDLPDGANSVSLISQAVESGRNMFGGFVAPEPGTGIIGSGQALHLLRGLCTVASQTCDFAFSKATVVGDPGSAVYGDRPLVSVTNGGRTILMRVYSFTPKEPVAAKAAQQRAETAFEEWQTATDPLHKQAALRKFELNLFLGASAEMYRMTANFVTGAVVPTALTADGGNYLGLTGGYDLIADRFVVVGAPVFAPDTVLGLRAQAKSGALSRTVASRSKGVVNGLEIRETDDVPDLRVDAVRLSSGTFGPSTALQATVTVTNAGSAFSASSDGPVSLSLRLGAPTGTGPPLASVAMPNFVSGEQRDFVLAFTTPANAFADEESMLYASLVLDAETPDLDGANNVGVLPLPGLPVPTTLLTSTRTGYPVTQLTWRGSTDPRVAGYRVYRREPNGSFVPLGASTEEGFLDLSAQFGVMRTYAVTTYSQRGVESPLSDPVSAAPVAKINRELGDLLIDGFEALVP